MSWALLILGAFAAGVAKTSVGGLTTLTVMLFAIVLPTKESTGAVLLVYIAGDLVAMARYRSAANWDMLRKLIPWVLPGLVLGNWFLHLVDANGLRRSIGVMLAASVVIQLVISRPRRPRIRKNLGDSGSSGDGGPRTSALEKVATSVAGIAAGFTTMAANTGGPVMTLFLLAKKVDKMTFVGTAAWYFFLINLVKVPFSIGVGAITWDIAATSAWLVPVVWAGAFVGIRLLRIIPQKLFDFLAVASSAVAATVLLAT